MAGAVLLGEAAKGEGARGRGVAGENSPRFAAPRRYLFGMTPEQKKLVEELRQCRLNQPCMTSEEFVEQMERNRRSVAARSGNASSASETPSSDGREAATSSSMAASI